MAGIVWPDSKDFESTVSMLKDHVSNHNIAIHGNGKEGLLDWAAGIKAQLRLVVFLVSVTAAMSGVALVIVTLKH